MSDMRDKIQTILETIRESDNESVWEHSVNRDALILAVELQFVDMIPSDREYYSLTDTGHAWLLIREARLHPNYDKLKEVGGVLFIPSTRHKTFRVGDDGEPMI